MRVLSSVMILTITIHLCSAQGNVGIGTGTPDASAQLDITATDKGLVIPRLALTAANVATPVTSPVTSLLVYNTATAGSGANAVSPGYYYWNGTRWVRFVVGTINDIAWLTTGNSGTTGPSAPATYGTSTFGASENWLGTTDGQPLTIGTSNIERMRISSAGLIGIGTATPTTNYLLTINPFNDTYRNGIDMNFPGSGTITTTAYGLDIDVTTNQNIRGFRYVNSTTGNGPFWGTGSELSATNIVSGYSAYRNNTGLSYGLYGINGTNAVYATNANTWAAFLQGRTVISSESSPSSPLGVDLEVRNTSAGASNPATISLRQTTSVTGIGTVLANLNFGDNYQTGPQAQIRVLREQASASSSDLPTSIGFWTVPDASTTLTERLRISSNGNVGVGIFPADVSALLDVSSTSKGIRPPSVALTATNAAGPVTTPATSLLVYNSATAGTSPTNVTPGYYYNAGTSGAPNWKRFSTGKGDAWITTGNDGTTDPTSAIGSTINNNFIGTTDVQDFAFATNNLERMRLWSSGQLSIGYNAGPGAKLDVHQTTSTATLRLYNYGNANDMEFRRSSGTLASPTSVTTAGTVLGRMFGMGYDGTSYQNSSSINFEVDASAGAGDMPGRITFNTTLDGSATVSERMRITNAGYVGINTTGPPTFLTVNHSGTTPATTNTYPFAIQHTGATNFTIGSDASYAYLQSWSSKPLLINSQGNNVGVKSTSTPLQDFEVNGRINVVNGVIQRGGTAITTTSDLGLYSRVSGNWMRFVTNAAQFVWFTDDGIGTTARMVLDANGNLSVPTGYLTVGNTTAPPSQSINLYRFVDINPNNGFGGVETLLPCGTTEWYLNISTSNKNYFYYQPPASRTFARFVTNWFWMPTGITSPYIDMYYSSTISDYSGSNAYDGVYLEYTTDGTNFSKLTPTGYDAYNFSTLTGTSPTACGSNLSGANCWSGSISSGRSTFTPTASNFAGKWVRLSLASTSDASVSGGAFVLYGISMDAYLPSGLLNGSYQTGSIYAQKNVYAGSNVLMGDVAEYFSVKDPVEAGDLVSVNSAEKDSYIKSCKKGDPNVIGIVSTAPTLTINSPVGSPIALSGRVPVKVNAENGSIRIGDYLTASSEPGYAMKASGNAYVIGKALEEMNGKEGKVVCLIQNGWINQEPISKNVQSSGTSTIRKGEKSVIVKDPGINADSRIFYTMLGNPGSYQWLSNKTEGSFELSLATPATSDVTFDYFVENASQFAAQTDKIPEGVKVIKNDVEYTELKPVPQATPESMTVPPIPPDPTKFWKYSNGQIVEVMPPVVKKNSDSQVVSPEEKMNKPEQQDPKKIKE